MRKWRLLTVLLAALAVTGLLMATLWISGTGKCVTYDETVLQGDASAFAGVTIRTRNQMREYVNWETEYRPGTGETPETKMRYRRGDWQYRGEAIFSVRTPLLPMTNGAVEGVADEMVRDVASRAPADVQEYQERVRAADYYDVFPMQYVFDECNNVARGQSWKLNELLQIPVPEDLTLLVSIYFYGHPNHARYNCTIDAAEGTVPELGVSFAKQESKNGGVYWFTLDCSLPGNGTLDTSRISGGTGIFRFDTAENTAETVYPFPAETKICDLWLSEDESTLYLLRSLSGVHTLTALSVPDMTETQVLTLPTAVDAALTTPYRRDGLLLVPATDGTLLVLTRNADNTYTLEKQMNAADDPALTQTDYMEPWEQITADYWDGRLALVRLQFADGDITQDMDLVISVYAEDGARSTMESRCSLGQDNDPELMFREYHHTNYPPIQPAWTDPVQVEIDRNEIE